MATDIPAATRKLVLERDRNRCRWCGRTNGGLHLHHIVYRSGGGGHHSPDILITLCPQHHQLVHSDKRRYQPLLFELMGKPGVTGLQLVRWKAKANLADTDSDALPRNGIAGGPE